MSAILSLIPVILGAGAAVRGANRTVAGKAPPDPWDDWYAHASADLDRRRRYCLARMGRRWLLHPDNRVQRK